MGRIWFYGGLGVLGLTSASFIGYLSTLHPNLTRLGYFSTLVLLLLLVIGWLGDDLWAAKFKMTNEDWYGFLVLIKVVALIGGILWITS